MERDEDDFLARVDRFERSIRRRTLHSRTVTCAWTVAGAFLVLLGAAPLNAQGITPLSVTVDRAAAEFMKKQRVPGVAIAIVKHGAVVYQRGYGLADVSARIPVTTDTRFEIGSITKQFTAACILQQVRAGTLSLDDTLGKYVTEYSAGALVTVRQMLSHTSGIPDYAFYGDPAQPTTLAAILERIAKKPLDFAPGSKWAYSNTNYVLLGRILELTSHEPYEQYVRKHTFEPAAMTQSGFMSDERTLPNMALGYERSGALGIPIVNRGAAGADGAIVSTVGDVAKWDSALARGAIVPLDDVALMRTAVALNGGASAKYGFGWAVDSLGGHPRYSHEGGTEGFAATNAVFPSDAESIIVLANQALSSPNRVASAIFTDEHPDIEAKFNTPASGEDKAVTALLTDVLRRANTGRPNRNQFSQRFVRAFVGPDGGSAEFIKEELAPLGPATKFVFRGTRKQPANPSTSTPAITSYDYNVAFGSDREFISIGLDADKKITAFHFVRYDGAEIPAKLDTTAKEDGAVTARLGDWLSRLSKGDIDRSQLTASFSAFYSPAEVLGDRKTFGPLGAPKSIVFVGQSARNGATAYRYRVNYASVRMLVDFAIDADGKIAGWGYGRLR